MKDLLTQKEALIPLCLAESPERSLDIDFELPENGTLNVCRSATVLGLAISMGAAGMLFSQHRATAANSVLYRPTLSTVTIPLGTPQSLAPNSPVIRLREVPLLKSGLKSGESLPQLTEADPRHASIILAAHSANNLSAPKEGSDKLLPSGQSATTTIPLAIATQPTPQAAPEFDPSLDHLQSTRQRLQAELADLQSEQVKATTDRTDEIGAQIQSNDVSQPLQEADPLPTAVGTPSRLYSGRGEPSPVPQTTTLAAATILENGFNQPIPIPVPTPESAIPQAVPLRRIAAPQPFEADPASSNRSPDGIPQKATGSRLNPSDQSSPSLAAFNQPIPLPVPTPASQINLATPMSPPELPPASPQAIPIQSDDDSVSSSSDQTYQVRPGDTLNSIARRHGLTIEQLIRANQITQPNVITVSQSLVIPPQSTASRRDPSQSSSQNSSQNSSLSPLRLPVAVSPSADALPSATTHNPTEAVENTPQPISISEASLDQSYTEKLKADVSHLESTSGHPISGIAIPVTQPPDPGSISSVSDDGNEIANSEWQSDRKTLSQRNRSPELPPLSRPASALTQGELISAAPINVQEYNNNLRIPVGQEVSPELPPLSGPDHYLPDAPMQSDGYIWPAKGVLTSGYGWRWGRMHKGIDIAAPIGTPILSAAPGVVISAGWNSGGYGNLVKILHADGSITLYAHNSRILVRKGQQVAQGEQIAAMGSTGFSTGPHLHFEVHPGGKSAVNPMAYLPSKGKNL